MITCNRKQSQKRQEEVKAYFEKYVMKDKFFCKMYNQCKSSHNGVFYEGQLHHIGKFYDLVYQKKPFKIIIVGQEYGVKPAMVKLEKRYEDIMYAAYKKRFNAENNFESRNPHMRGTTSVLKVLLGLPLSNIYEDEFVTINNTRQHIFDSFSLVNYLLCSAIPFEGNKKGKSTREMKRNCKIHFRNVIEILEPDIIIVQGKTFFPWINKSFDSSESITENLYESKIGTKESLVASFSHPSAHFPDNWGANENTPYLINTVLPTVTKIRKLIGVE